MGEVELFKIWQGGETCDAGEAVGLNGDDAEVGEVVKVLDRISVSHVLSINTHTRTWVWTHLHLGDLILPEPELLQSRQSFQVLDFLCHITSVIFVFTRNFTVILLLTLIRFAPSSKFRRAVNPSSPSM